MQVALNPLLAAQGVAHSARSTQLNAWLGGGERLKSSPYRRDVPLIGKNTPEQQFSYPALRTRCHFTTPFHPCFPVFQADVKCAAFSRKA